MYYTTNRCFKSDIYNLQYSLKPFQYGLNPDRKVKIEDLISDQCILLFENEWIKEKIVTKQFSSLIGCLKCKVGPENLWDADWNPNNANCTSYQTIGMKDLKLVQINLFTTNAYTTLKLNHLGNWFDTVNSLLKNKYI